MFKNLSTTGRIIAVLAIVAGVLYLWPFILGLLFARSYKGANRVKVISLLLVIFSAGNFVWFQFISISSPKSTETFRQQESDNRIGSVEVIKTAASEPVSAPKPICSKDVEKARECKGCNVAEVKFSNSDCSTYTKESTDTNCSELCPKIETPPPSPSYKCDCKKSCSKISSCEEAYYQLESCRCNNLDGDSDGTPCESKPLKCG